MNDKINDIDPAIAAWHDEWERNRDFVEGERAIKGNALTKGYLLKEGGLDRDQLLAINRRTTAYPGAARTHDGMLGLMFRKPATVEAPAALGSILETITPDFLTIHDLAEEVASEFLITNFVGMLVDLTSTSGSMSVAQAEKMGVHPKVAVYRAETILGVEPGLVNGGLGIVRVRLQDDELTIRELRLEPGMGGGRYSVTMWRRETEHAEYKPDEPIYPARAGKPLDFLPFTLVCTNRRFKPAKAKLSDVCALNAQHFLASADVAALKYAVGRPTPYLFGPATIGEVSFGYGKFITGTIKSGNDIKLGFWQAGPEGIKPLTDDVAEIASQMAKVGARILADEKAGVEGPETIKVKMASENAALASTSRFVSRKITDALKIVAWWLGYEEGSISYEANTDYGTAQLSQEEVASRLALYQAGVISLDAFLDMLIEGEVLPETFDKEADAAKKSQEIADRPPVMAIPSNPVSGEEDAG